MDFIAGAVRIVQKKLNKKKLKMFDAFSGSGIVARFFKQFSDLLVVNDLEKYSKVINECYLSNENEHDLVLLRKHHNEIISELSKGLKKGLISELYAPEDDKNVTAGERVFYTSRNAMYIDTARQLIQKLPEGMQNFFLAPLLSEASIHTNTSGVFKGFYKEKGTGIGQFGGSNKDALFRITGEIQLPFPLFSNFNCETIICNDDANIIVKIIPEVDVAYLDPPYNQHPYGSNYFMLNMILDYRYPENLSKVSGIPTDWNRSFYNKEHEALEALTELVEKIDARYIILSFNSEGFIKTHQMVDMLTKMGKVEVFEKKYNTFKGSRNLNNREIHVKEFLFLLEK